MFPWFPYFTLKLFNFSCIRMLVYFRIISPQFVGRIFFGCFGMSCFTFCRYLFTNAFWFISKCCVVIFSCVIFSLLFPDVPAFFLFFIILACFRRFLIGVSSRISQPGFDFSLVLFREFRFSHKLILLLHKLLHFICVFFKYMLVIDFFFCFHLNNSPFYVSQLWWGSIFPIHHHHHLALVARISLTLSRHSSLSFIALGRSSGQHPVSSHSCWMYVRAGRPAFAQPCVGVHKSTSLMSSSLLLQQCPACLVRLTWIVFAIGGRWPYSWCLVGCCRQD